MNFKRSIIKGVEWILDICYPRKCLFCSEILPFGEKGIFCGKCLGSVHFVETYCEKCGKEIAKNDDLCYDCRTQVHFFDKGRSLFIYENKVKDAIISLKYNEKMYFAKAFAQLMSDFYSEQLKWNVDMIIAVPMHEERLRIRGYNQSALIAKAFAGMRDIPYEAKALQKIKNTRAQKTLGRQDRMKNILSSFRANNIVKGKKILLIDDVYTTGATMDSCAKSLVDAGSKEIYFISIATGKRL